MSKLYQTRVVVPVASIAVIAIALFLADYVSSIKEEKEELEEEMKSLDDDNKTLEEIQEGMKLDNDNLTNEVDKKNVDLSKAKKQLKDKDKVIKNKDTEIKNKDSTINSLKESKAKKEEIKQANEKDKVKTNTKNNPIQMVSNKTNKTSKADKNTGQEQTSEESGKSTHNMNATHYTAFCDTGCTGKTATGVNVSNTTTHDGKRVIAVDPSVIPLGSDVKVSGGGHDFIATAQDTGGDIKGNRIDILVASESEARSLGRSNVTVKVLN